MKALVTSSLVTYVLVGCSFFTGTTPLAAQQDLRGALNKILATIVNHESLHGSWVTVGLAERGGPWLFNLSVDSSRAAQQEAALRKLIAETVGNTPFRISNDVAKKDVSGSVRALQDAISEDNAFQGVALKDAYFAPLSDANSTNRRLVLNGRSPFDMSKRKDLQQALLIKYNDVLKNYPNITEGDDAKTDINIVNPSTLTNGIRLVPNSTWEGERLYTMGMHKFNEGQYHDAARLFATASIEAPNFTEAKVWQALSLMQMGDEGAALKRLKYLVKQEREAGYSSSHSVANSLESLQGPLRTRFDELVRRAFND